MERFVVLLRGINVNGRSLPMAALKAALRGHGFPDAETYIQSGNLVLSAPGGQAEVAAQVADVIRAGFGLEVGTIARTGTELARIAGANPFPDASPKALHLCLAAGPIADDAAPALAARATAGERIAVAAGALWIDFAGGVAGSKLMPNVIDRAAGSTVTARNWNTVGKLLALAGQQGDGP